jgi:hypothetical protein
MSVHEAIALLKAARDIPQPSRTPLPLDAVLQFPRYYEIMFNGQILVVRGVTRTGQWLKWYIIIDLYNKHVIDHGYWHPSIFDELITVLEKAKDDP